MTFSKCNFCLSFLSIFILLLLLELILRFFPVTELSHSRFVSESDTTYRFRPNQDVMYSKGYAFQIAQKKHINNDGFYSSIDYTKSNKNVVSIIGDSFVEAKQVSDDATMHGILNKLDDFDYYAFGVSGAPLSQYLEFAKYAKKYKPSAWVFVVISNDFDESMCRYKRTPGFYCFEEDSQSDGYSVVLNESTNKGIIHSVLKQSALVRYLYLTAGVRPSVLISKITGLLEEKSVQSYKNNILAEFDEERLTLGYQAIDLFFETLVGAHGIDPKKVLIISDANRPDIYDSDYSASEKKSYFSAMKARLLEKSAQYNFEYIDLNDEFIKDYQKHNNRFEFDSDNHWNEKGHMLVSRVIYNSQTIKNLREEKQNHHERR